ncbi:MAG: MlaD family protein [Proteobacteria bacterium]|nr:MlaD family protein [Pseudomonadota bacterium]
MKNATMKTKMNLGVFILSVCVVIGLLVVIAGDKFSVFKRSRNFKALFDNTSGLVQGAPIRIGGVEVGRVAKIVIESRPKGLAISATLRIDSPYFELISHDASVGLDTQGLLGDKFIALNPGTATMDGALVEGAMIQTRAVEGLARVMVKTSDIVDTVSSTAQKIDTFVSGLPDRDLMKATTADFTESARAIRLLIGQLGAKDSLFSTLNDPQSQAILKRSLLSLESAAVHSDSIAKKIDSGQGTIGALVNDRTLYEDLRSILGHVDRGKIARRVFIEAATKDTEKTE